MTIVVVRFSGIPASGFASLQCRVAQRRLRSIPKRVRRSLFEMNLRRGRFLKQWIAAACLLLVAVWSVETQLCPSFVVPAGQHDSARASGLAADKSCCDVVSERGSYLAVAHFGDRFVRAAGAANDVALPPSLSLHGVSIPQQRPLLFAANAPLRPAARSLVLHQRYRL